jgi:FkbM family methyltransferase
MPEDPRLAYAVKATQALAARARSPRRPVEFRSQCGEDALLWELFQGQLTGFYIEVGAFNGLDLSPTYAYDCVGWDGLLIEAIPRRAQECAQNRPTARVVHAALGPHGSSGTTSFTVTTDKFGGMLSHLSSSAGHGEGDAVTSQEVVTVPFTTMDALLDAAPPRDIDFAIIDVEGAEVPLLEGFDLRRHRPRILLIEDERDKPTTPVEAYMAMQQYAQLGWIAFNRIYARRDLAADFATRL